MGRISIASGFGLAEVTEHYVGATGTRFWALVLFENRLTRHVRNEVAGVPWYQFQVLTENASAPASLVNVVDRGHYSKYIPRPSPLETVNALVLEGNSLSEFPDMVRGGVLTTAATGPAALIQGLYGRGTGPGNLEALVIEGRTIIHYWKSYFMNFNNWNRGVVVTKNASGPACLIEGDFDDSNLEALIPEGDQLIHYWRTSKPDFEWHRGVVVCDGVSGAATMIQSGFRSKKTRHGNFEVLVWQGRDIVHYWRDNSDPNKPWHRGAIVSQNATGPASMIEGFYGKDAHHVGNFEVLIPEGDDLIGYYRDNRSPGLPWHRIGVAI